MALQIAARPATIDGCMQYWREQSVSNLIRSDMDWAIPKVRRRTTGRYRKLDAVVVLKGEVYNDFVTWFEVNCRQGVDPTKIITPNGVEEVWRFSEPPSIEWIQSNAFRATMKFERLPGWP